MDEETVRPERRMLASGASAISPPLIKYWSCRNDLPEYNVRPLVLNQVCRNDRTFGKARLWTLCTYCALVCPCGLYVPTVPCVLRWEASGEVMIFHGNYRGTSLLRNSPPPKGFHMALGIVLLQGPKRRRFLESEVPLYLFNM